MKTGFLLSSAAAVSSLFFLPSCRWLLIIPSSIHSSASERVCAMEREVLALSWADDTRYKRMPGVLPKLRIKEESNRRDSLSSERTGDSGYISDPEISLSPLDFGGQDNSKWNVRIEYKATDAVQSNSGLRLRMCLLLDFLRSPLILRRLARARLSDHSAALRCG